MDLSLIICCYNEEPHLRQSVQELVNLLKATRFSFEFIFVEDCSTDKTREVLQVCEQDLRQQNISFTTILHETNKGRGASVKDGYEASQGTIAGFIDIDLEHLPEGIIPTLNKLLNQDCDMIVGQRFFNMAQVRFVRLITHLVYKKIISFLMKLPVEDSEAGFKFFNRKNCLQAIRQTEDPGWFWDTEIVAVAQQLNLKIAEHSIVFHHKPEKKSTVRVFRDSWRYLMALWVFKRKSTKPATTTNVYSRH